MLPKKFTTLAVLLTQPVPNRTKVTKPYEFVAGGDHA